MKILQLIDTLDAGGAERMAVTIANAVNSAGCSSYICATRRGGALENEIDTTIPLLILNKKGTLDFTAFRTFFKWLRKEEIAIIHAHSTSILLATLAKLNNRKLKIVWHDHYGLSDRIEDRPARVLQLLARFIDVSITVNDVLAQWSKHVLKIKNVVFLNNFAQLSTGQEKGTVLKGIDGKRIICLANLRPQKNHLELIRAFQKSIQQFPEWTLHLVGKSFEDEYAQAIVSFVAEYNLSDNVYLYGSRNDISNILEQSTIGVLASISEGLPVSLLEYGNSGLPVIVTDVGQCSAVVTDFGIVIKNVEEEMSVALLNLYKKDQRQLELMGSRFRESVKKTYSKEAFLEKLLPIYKDLIS